MTNRSSLAGDNGISLARLVASWERSLRATNTSWRTIRSYGSNVQLFLAWLDRTQPEASTTATIAREHCEAYLADCLQRCTPGTVFTYHKCIRLFFAWCVEESEMTASPMLKVKRPRLIEHTPPIIADDQLRALIHACEGKDFLERRDMALVRLLIDIGLRRGEIGGLQVADIDLDARVAHIRGTSTRSGDHFGAKGHKARVVPFGVKAASALDRYLRARAQHRYAELPDLWLTQQGPLTYNGVYNLIQRRAKQADVPAHLWPHLFRHTSTNAQLARGDQEGDIMARMGWRSRDMLGRYGASVAAERARESYHRQPSPGDLL